MVIGKKQTLEDVKNEALKKRLSKEISKNELIAFSHSGALIASVSKKKGIRVWDLKNMRERPIVIHENDSIRSFIFTEDDSQIACSLINSPKDNSVVHLWSLKMDSLANELCSLLKRNMLKDEWEQYVGGLPYESTCKK